MQNGGRFDVLRFILLSNPVIASQSADWRGNPYSLLVASVGVGVPDDPPLTAAPPLIPRRTAPMCAAADHRRTFNPCHCEPAHTLVWQSVPPLRRTPVIWKNGFPRRFAPRNDIFIIPPSVGVGVPDDPHAQPPCHAVGATLAVARRTPQTLSLRASAHTGVAIRTPLA